MKSFVLWVIIVAVQRGVQSLRCHNDDGPSSSDIKRTVRVCMRRIGSGFNGPDYDEYDNYDSSSDNNDGRYGWNHNNGNQRGSSGNGGGNGGRHRQVNRGGRFKRQFFGNSGGWGSSGGNNGGWGNSNNNNNNNNGGWGHNQNGQNCCNNQGSHSNNHGWGQGFGFGRFKRQMYPGQQWGMNNGGGMGWGEGNWGQNGGRRMDGDRFGGSNVGNEGHDRTCVMQCLFEEYKMTDSEGFPERNKVLHVLTKNMRDYQVRDFFSDSVQECFHVLEMGAKSDKCEFSKNLLTCLSERAKLNCDDWNNDENVLF